jgi:small membrane protein
MIARVGLTALLMTVFVYAAIQYRRSRWIGGFAVMAALAGLYFVWVPDHATALAGWAGIGRGADLVLYTWVAISLIMLLNLHLKLRSQMELITALARAAALDDAKRRTRDVKAV